MKKISLCVLLWSALMITSVLPSLQPVMAQEEAELCAELHHLKDMVTKQLTTDLFEALKENNFQKVQASLEELKKVHPDILKNELFSDDYRLDPLTFSIIFETDVEIMKYLIQEGASVNPKDRFNNLDLIEILVSQTFSAIAHKLFLEKSTSVPPLAFNDVKEEAYLYEVAKMLIEHGAPFTAQTIQGARENNLNEVAYLLEANLKGKAGTTPLLRALDSSDIELAESLLQQGAAASINIPDQNRCTPLSKMVSRRNVKLVKLLLDHGAQASVNMPDGYGQTPLSKAVSNADVELVKLLLDHGGQASVNMPDRYGQTPFSKAVSIRKAELVKLLLDHGGQASKVHE